MDYKDTTDINPTTFRTQLTECFRRSKEFGEIFCVKKDNHRYFFFDQSVFEFLLKEAGYGLTDEPTIGIIEEGTDNRPSPEDVK